MSVVVSEEKDQPIKVMCTLVNWNLEFLYRIDDLKQKVSRYAFAAVDAKLRKSFGLPKDC